MGRSDSVPAPAAEGGRTIDRRPPDFTIDDLLAELQSAQVSDALTVTDLCERAGIVPTHANLARVRNKIHDLVVQGRWEYAGTLERANMIGQPRRSPAYRPKPSA